MALVVKDRVRETSTTTGTGTFTLAGAVAGFQSFTAIGTGNTTYYTIVMSGDWEVGLGTWTSPNQLSRDTVLASSNAGALVPFGSGTKDVFCTFPAEGFALPPAIGGTTPNTITGSSLTSNSYINAVDDGSGTARFVLDTINWDGLYTVIDSTGIYKTDSTISYPIDFPSGLNGALVGSFYGSASISSAGIAFATNTGSPGNFARAITLKALATGVPNNYTLTLPSTAGSNNQVLKTDGSGNLSWLDFGSPPAIGGTTPSTGKFTTVESTATTGTAPFIVASTTNVANLNASSLNGATFAAPGSIGNTTAGSGAFTTLSASSTVSGTGFSTYLASPPAIGGTAPAAGSFTTLSATSVDNTSSIARAGGRTSVLSILNQATFTSGGTTLASQTAANNSTWRIRAFGTFTAANNATARTAQVSVFWGSTQLVAITPSVLVSTAQTTSWQLDFTVTGSSTTAVWTAGTLLNRVASATALAVDNATAASTTVTSGAQTIDLRFRVSTGVASEGWNVQSVTIERLV